MTGIPKHGAVQWDDQGIHLLSADVPAASHVIPWTKVVRTGYVTQDSLGCEDYFRVVETDDTIYFLSQALLGGDLVFREIDRRFPPIFGGKGTLASSVGNDSVATWPLAFARGSLFAMWAADQNRGIRKNNIWAFAR